MPRFFHLVYSFSPLATPLHLPSQPRDNPPPLSMLTRFKEFPPVFFTPTREVLLVEDRADTVPNRGITKWNT